MATSTSEVTLQTRTLGTPLLSFGMIADLQYADTDNRMNYQKTKMRYYRNSLVLLNEAVEAWKSSERPIDFVVQLGDLLDGANTKKGSAESDAKCRILFAEFAKSAVPIHHVIGNHEVYNYNRRELYEKGFLTGYELSKKHDDNKPEGSARDCHESSGDVSFEGYCESLKAPVAHYPAFYHIQPCSGFRFLFLDTYDLSVHGYDPDSERHKKSLAFLRLWNKNDAWNVPDGLGDKSQMVAFNGGVGEEQLEWLKKQLEAASQQNEKVVLFAHIPLYQPASDNTCLVWNYEEVLDTIHRFNAVVAVFAGHYHDYGYGRDHKGIHHVVMPGIIETPPGQNGYATVDVYKDKLHVRGVGEMKTSLLEI